MIFFGLVEESQTAVGDRLFWLTTIMYCCLWMKTNG